MKNLFILSGLLAALSSACHSDGSIKPVDFLYQRWHLFQSRKVQDSAWITNTDGFSDIEYRPDNTLIYRQNGVVTPTPCCASNRFERDGKIIRFLDQTGCAYALCASLSGTNTSTITALTDKLLELESGDWITQYTPA